jgi:hypothetical protein
MAQSESSAAGAALEASRTAEDEARKQFQSGQERGFEKGGA